MSRQMTAGRSASLFGDHHPHEQAHRPCQNAMQPTATSNPTQVALPDHMTCKLTLLCLQTLGRTHRSTQHAHPRMCLLTHNFLSRPWGATPPWPHTCHHLTLPLCLYDRNTLSGTNCAPQQGDQCTPVHRPEFPNGHLSALQCTGPVDQSHDPMDSPSFFAQRLEGSDKYHVLSAQDMIQSTGKE